MGDVEGHWEEYGHYESDWMYQCNYCGATFNSVDAFYEHSDLYWDDDGKNYHSNYTQIPSDPYWVIDGKEWIDEVGHWEYR